MSAHLARASYAAWKDWPPRASFSKSNGSSDLRYLFNVLRSSGTGKRGSGLTTLALEFMRSDDDDDRRTRRPTWLGIIVRRRRCGSKKTKARDHWRWRKADPSEASVGSPVCAMPAPPQVTEWLRKAYPRPEVDPVRNANILFCCCAIWRFAHSSVGGQEWLDACYAWIVSELRLDPSTQMQQIIQNVEHQLLCSHLSDSMIQGTGLPPNVAGTSDTTTTTTRLRGPPVLVEILSIMEIGHSAFALNNTRQARIDKADLTGLGAEGAAGDGEEKIPKYPRSMLHFELSDGSLTFEAMEYRSIPQIQLGVTELGYKVRARRRRKGGFCSASRVLVTLLIRRLC